MIPEMRVELAFRDGEHVWDVKSIDGIIVRSLSFADVLSEIALVWPLLAANIKKRISFVTGSLVDVEELHAISEIVWSAMIDHQESTQEPPRSPASICSCASLLNGHENGCPLA